MSNKVALIGAGAMGGAIGTRLLETNHELYVFDLNKEQVQKLADKGAVAATSAADAASQSDYVITSLNSALPKPLSGPNVRHQSCRALAPASWQRQNLLHHQSIRQVCW